MYRRIGSFFESHFYDLFEGLHESLHESNIKTTLGSYLGILFLSFFIPFLISFAFFYRLTIIKLGYFPLGFTLVASFLISLFISGLVYIYPFFKAYERRLDIDMNLPYAVNYISIMAGAGMPPAVILKALGLSELYGEVSEEAKTITRDIEIFGEDLSTALENACKRSPSSRLKEILMGINNTIKSSGDLKIFLREVARELTWEHRKIQREFTESLGLMTEIYITLFVVAPVFLIVMVAVMTMMGGWTLKIPVNIFFQMMIYLFIPIACIMFLIIVDSLKPKV
ncbi:MAG: type II secretion system F family protein [Candidatus Hydrothermarchaeota archaeon]